MPQSNTAKEQQVSPFMLKILVLTMALATAAGAYLGAEAYNKKHTKLKIVGTVAVEKNSKSVYKDKKIDLLSFSAIDREHYLDRDTVLGSLFDSSFAVTEEELEKAEEKKRQSSMKDWPPANGDISETQMAKKPDVSVQAVSSNGAFLNGRFTEAGAPVMIGGASVGRLLSVNSDYAMIQFPGFDKASKVSVRQ